jgi:hypothetical protein
VKFDKLREPPALICGFAILLSLSLYFHYWLHEYEAVAVWLEAAALVALFFLDYLERRDNRAEREEQHKETLAQLQLARAQAQSATEAAVASTKSSNILTALHRPFMSLGGTNLKSGWGSRSWEVEFLLKNYGTLPAVNVGLTVDFFTDEGPRQHWMQPGSLQIFPSSVFNAVMRFDIGDDWAPIQQEIKNLRISVRIPYETEDGRRFEYTAELLHKHGGFHTDKSETKTISAGGSPA